MVIQIKIPKKNTFWIRRKIKAEGFIPAYDGKFRSTWQLKVSDNDAATIRKWKRFAKKKQFECIVTQDRYSRASNYRSKYISYDPGHNGWYFCLYCGRPMRKDQMTVDHIVPVDRAGRSWFVQKYLSAHGIEDVNDYKNLGPCCKRCNRKKSNHFNPYWMIQARLGKIRGFWLIRLETKLLIITVVVYMICRYIFAG